MHFKKYLYLIILFFSCCNNNSRITQEHIDKIVSEYDNVSFNEICDISVSERSRGLNSLTYIVGKGEGNLPVYFVTLDPVKKNIIDVNSTNLKRLNIKEYLSREEISKAINVAIKYGFYFFAKDSAGNIYINPFYPDEPPYFLRMSTAIGDSIVKKGYVYELYREKWYINKTRRKD